MSSTCASCPAAATLDATSRRAQRQAPRCLAAHAGPSSSTGAIMLQQSVVLGRGKLFVSGRGQRGVRRTVTAAAAVVCSASAVERVLVAGATSRAGQLVIEHLRAAGHEIIAFARDESMRESLIQRGASKVLPVDALDAAAVQRAVVSVAPTIVVSFIGAAPKMMCGGPDFEGNKNMIDAAKAAGAKRFVLVSALGAGNSLDCIPHASQDVLKPWLEQKTKAEEYLVSSGLEFVVVRPGPLTEEATVSAAVVSVDACDGRAYSMMSREELGRVTAEVALSPAAANQVYAVIDPGKVVVVVPSMRALEPWESLPFTVVTC